MSDSPGSPKRCRPRRLFLRRSALLCVLLIAMAVTLVACGGGSSTSSPSTTAGAVQQALKYAQCMRSHGVTNYPDPTPGKSQSIGQSGLDTNSPTYQAAASACKQYQPTAGNSTNQGTRHQASTAQLKFAECMRSHGVTNFPEGNGNGGGGQQSLSQYGIDTNSPTFQRANQACSSLLSGGGS